ncbi:hypothetical protein [Spirosoma radiotolerans]|uniref:Uncharacterized protein n=1 Tax=Spirosoma radiotolerans TaxID=1379870 RepID=A0A0E3ZVX6_9BACT|nr:hypothetical protein [Spirosoma radiotolerans]AKD55379.1 hypothetical protein SD10_11190 [Spirosoma radiotolerans]
MSFKSLQIRYQTARSLPAPYSYFYTLSITTVAANAIQVDLAITYPDRDDIDDDELIAEGYTRDDDYAWSGRLPRAWGESLAALVRKTRLQPLNEDELNEDDDFWDITIEMDGTKTSGKPAKPDDWQYLMQELIQATYEAVGRERPFELTYLNLSDPKEELEVRLTASFAERTVTLTTVKNRREQTKTLAWSTLQHVMSQVYTYDYDPDDAQLKRPRRDGQWLNLGTEEWYDIGNYRALGKLFREL